MNLGQESDTANIAVGGRNSAEGDRAVPSVDQNEHVDPNCKETTCGAETKKQPLAPSSEAHITEPAPSKRASKVIETNDKNCWALSSASPRSRVPRRGSFVARNGLPLDLTSADLQGLLRGSKRAKT